MLGFKSGNAETFYEAAELKYREASALMNDELYIGGCYLLGYVIEMIFKCTIAEIGYPAYEDKKGRTKIKDDFGHDLLELREGLSYMLSKMNNDDYREILEQLDTDLQKKPFETLVA